MPDDAPRTDVPASRDYDPLVLNSRRELKVTLLVWTGFAIWVISVSWWGGRDPVTDPDSIKTVLGIPSWVFWGVALPWLVANLFTFWFCFRFMAEDRLDEPVEEELFHTDPAPEKEFKS